ncbi:thioesterase family protein [Herbiconiux moechotypicola]|uniref:Acyl-CoA thioesterase II n=1 Tax=Herbiconiux moechotypicola TaxID=637393 RepID=A0ABP5Q7A1_9MICO|nr:acyl-CoA thioesterase domain-containing protein [Herbiconiux moechotypicola]MCS5728682.1 thioesterase family protein [Herbiconiux moechotypicola]
MNTLPFLSAIELTELPGTAETSSTAVFSARTQHVPWPKSYGGDVLAQAAAAGIRTVGDDRSLHAMHSLFVAPASVGEEIEYRVTSLRDGRSYSSREVKGYQHGAVVVSSVLSFHVGEESATVAVPLPEVAQSEDLPSAAEAVEALDRANPGRIPAAAAAYWSATGEGGRSFDLRHVEGALYASPAHPAHASVETPTGTPTGAPTVDHVWVRPFAPLPADQIVHDLALVHVCDYSILEPVLRGQGRAWTDPGLTTASLDHSFWLHERVPFDDWVLYTQTVESYGHGRALVRGTMHSRDGRLLASVAQQGMIRDRGPERNERS